MRRVVITGIGAVTPVGNDVKTFWNSLVNGVCGIDYITRFDTEDCKVKIAAELKNFDAADYVEDKSAIRKCDRFVIYAMAAAAQAMNDSDLRDIKRERLGVYIGSGIGGMDTFVTETEKLLTKGPSRISPFFIPMMIGNMAAGKIAIQFGAEGPTLPAVTACATSSHTIGEAYRAIKHGYADAIIAGGSEATITKLAVAGFTNCKALSETNEPNASSLPFDKRREGFVMGEGAGILILEEYERAVSRGARIYAEICGYGNTCDAHHITAPHPEAKGAKEAIRLAVEEGEISTDKLYINAHGTGTPLNDSAETLAIKNALGNDAKTALISSTKSMTGHMLGAAGAVEGAAAVLALYHGIVPPTINYKVPDPECDLNYVPNKAVKADITAALSISLGFGGHNACIAFKKFI